MIVILQREKSDEQGTFGRLTLETGEIFDTIELQWKANQSNISCIPLGEYKLKPRQSSKFHKAGGVWEVCNVQGRTDVLIHYGNYAGNTAKGYKTDSQGCILVGNGRADKPQKMINNSVNAMIALNKLLQSGEHALLIKDSEQ